MLFDATDRTAIAYRQYTSCGFIRRTMECALVLPSRVADPFANRFFSAIRVVKLSNSSDSAFLFQQ